MMEHRESSFLAIERLKGIPQYSDEAFSDAVTRLLMHKQSTIKFKSILSSANNAVLTGDYTLGRISHNYFTDCTFERASLNRVSGAGSIFTHVKFNESDLSKANFQSTTFESCHFNDCDLSGSNMSECYFHDTIWNTCPNGAANMSFSSLRNCQFIATKPGNLAESVLDNVYLEDIRLTNMNLEFSTFKRIKTDKVILAFSQMPYVFGGLQYLMTTSDSVKISSHINDTNSISVDEYIEVLADMEIFYSHQAEYFPLANILLSFHRYEEALTAILLGLQESAFQRDFRMCKYYCKLITENGNFSSKILSDLYQAVCNVAPPHSLTDSQYYQYVKHMPEMRSMLVENPNGYPHATLRLETNICEQDPTNISLLFSMLDELLHLNGVVLANPAISISHNSPITCIVGLCGLPLTILAVSALILKIISHVCETYNDVAQTVIATQTIAENQKNREQKALEIQKLKAEIIKLEMENSELRQKMNIRQQQITESGIIIVRSELSCQDFNPMKWL